MNTVKKINQRFVLKTLILQHCDQPWRAVPHPSTSAPPPGPTLSPTLVTSLQSRSLTESDYELLLNLGNPQPTRTQGASQRSRPPREGMSESLVMSLHVEPLDGNHPLIVGGASCHICRQSYVRGEWIKKLPCKHKV